MFYTPLAPLKGGIIQRYDDDIPPLKGSPLEGGRGVLGGCSSDLMHEPHLETSTNMPEEPQI